MISRVKEYIKTVDLSKIPHLKILIPGGVTVLALGLYLALHKGSSLSQKITTSREEPPNRTRILGDPYATMGKVRDKALDRATKGYSDSLKVISENLAKLEVRLTALEAKVAGESPLTAAAPSDSIDQNSKSSAGQPGQDGRDAGASARDLPRQPLDVKPDTHNVSMTAGGVAPSVSYDRRFAPVRGSPIITFPVPSTGKREQDEIAIPVGSYVKAKLLTGVEAPEGTPYPVLLQLDFAHVLPNKKSLDLRGCFMIAKAQGDLSTERVQMQATKLSCVARDGHMFERDVNGFVADAVDNSFAVVGSVNTKQDRVAAMAFLSSVVEGVGRAIQMAQTSEQTAADGSSRRILTGDQGKYIAAGGAGHAAGMVAEWYLKQAQNLLPTINVGSGQDVWIILNESVALPHAYFRKTASGDSHERDVSLINHLLD